MTIHPDLIIDGVEYEVAEISEAAIVFRSADLWRFFLSQPLQGALRFLDGEEHPISGTIYRIGSEKIVVLLQRHLPTARVFKEQWYLQNNQADYLN